MSHATLSASIFAVAVLIALAAVAPAAADTFLTTTVSLTGIKQVTVGTFPMVLVNYTATSTSSINGWVYLSLVNSAGQTVSLSVVYRSFGGSATGSFFVPIQPTAAGTYTAKAFATTTDNVALSAVRSMQVTV